MGDFPEAPEFLAQWLAVEAHVGGGLKNAGLSLLGRASATKQIYLILLDLEREKRVFQYSESAQVMRTGLHHRIRAKFETLVREFPRCAVGWRLFLAFEQKCGTQEIGLNSFLKEILLSLNFVPVPPQFYVHSGA